MKTFFLKDIFNIPRKNFFDNPKFYYALGFAWLVFGSCRLHFFHLFGVLLYQFVGALIFLMIHFSYKLFNYFDDRNALKWQVVLNIVALASISSTFWYNWTISSEDNVKWEPISFQYGNISSVDHPCENFFSGKLEDGEPLIDRGTLGFGFCRNDKTDPIYQKIEKDTPFVINYKVEKNILCAASIETKNDVDMTNAICFILKAAQNQKVIDLNEFEWLDDQSDIKHFKLNFILLPKADMILVDILLWLDLHSVVFGYYLIP